MEVVKDKAGEEYWTQVWKDVSLNAPLQVHSNSLSHFRDKELHEIFSDAFSGKATKGKTFLEVGCGNSVLLPYFAKEFGFAVTGLDYSEFGCEQSKKILQRDGVEGKIVCADFFSPPQELLGIFDVVGSFGVVEHFEDTAKTIEALSKFLKPGGLLITSIPNLSGLTGFLQKIFNKQVYNIHVIMDKKQLEKAIHKSGLELMKSRYYACFSMYVNLDSIDKPVSFLRAKKIVSKLFITASLAVLWLQKTFGSLPQSKFLSSGILTFAKKL